MLHNGILHYTGNAVSFIITIYLPTERYLEVCCIIFYYREKSISGTRLHRGGV